MAAVDDSTLLTIDDNFSRQQIETNTFGFGLWFGINDLRSVQLDDNGTVTDFRQAGTPMDLNGGTENRELLTNQVGINLQAFDARRTWVSIWTSRMPRASRTRAVAASTAPTSAMAVRLDSTWACACPVTAAITFPR